MSDKHIINTESGEWLHPSGTDLLFAFIQSDWSRSNKEKVIKAYNQTLNLFPEIQMRVKEISSKDVVNG